MKKTIMHIYIKTPKWVFPLLIIVIWRLFTMKTVTQFRISGDSISYINYSFKDFFSLNFDGRVPVYPAIIKLCNILFGEPYLRRVVQLQILASIVSTVFFYKAVETITKNKILLFILMLGYGVSYSVTGWDYAILTESFSLSGTVVLLYFLLKYLDKPRFLWGVLAVAVLFVLTFLRPSFLVFNFILAAFFILRLILCKSERPLALKLLSSSLAVLAFIGLYSYNFSRTHDMFSISDAVPRQHLYIILEEGYYKSCSDAEFVKTAEEIWNDESISEKWTRMTMIKLKYGNKKISEYNSECIQKNFLPFVKNRLKIATYTSYSILPGLTGHIEARPAILWPTIVIENMATFLRVSHAYLIVGIEALVAVFLWIKRKSPPWIHLGLFAFLSALLFTTFYGTCGEYERTMICILPFMYIAVALFFKWVNEDIAVSKNKEFDSEREQI